MDHTCITAMLLCAHRRHFLFLVVRYYNTTILEAMEKKGENFFFVFYIYVSHIYIYFAVSSSFLLGSFPTRLSALPLLLLPDSLLQMGERNTREREKEREKKVVRNRLMSSFRSWGCIRCERQVCCATRCNVDI